MKYSNYFGIAAAIALIIFCFLPWVYIAAIQTTITGMHSMHTNFGRPGAMHILLSVCSIILFSVPKVEAKRANLFVVTFNFAWAVRNFLLITQCELGDCPDKKAGIYAIIILSLVMLIMAMLPKLKLN